MFGGFVFARTWDGGDKKQVISPMVCTGREMIRDVQIFEIECYLHTVDTCILFVFVNLIHKNFR